MADDMDKTDERSAPLLDASIAEARRKAAAIPKGKAGECKLCGEYKARLVGGACGRCRDLHGLP